MSLRRMAELGRLTRAAAQLQLLRAGLDAGLFAALAEPRSAEELAESLGLAPDLCEAWLRAAFASGFVERRGGRYLRAALASWLLASPDADAARAMLDQAALSYAPVLGRLPALLREGAPRPRWGGDEEAARVARGSRLLEKRAFAALARVPGAARARRFLDVGCGEGTLLAALLSRYRDALGLGVEREPRLAELARARLRDAEVHRRGEIWSGDVMREELPAGDWDLATLNQVLHYWPDEERDVLFARIARRLAPNGVLAIQTLVLQDGAFARLAGSAASSALFDLFLRSHANLYGLPDPVDLQVRLRAAGFARVGSVSIVPGGGLRYVWAARGGSR
jgi:SAM-dependent methyltransferase